MLGSGSQVDAGCATSCSDDLRSVIDCNGNVVQSCAASDQCDTSAIQCTNACAAAEANHRSVGCDYYATYMDSEIPQYCFAVFVANLYVLDATSGQVWKHESFPGTGFQRAQAYLTDPIPTGTGRSIAVDQDIWIVTTQGDILRFRRLTTSFTATRVDFVPRWRGAPIRPTAVQAIDVQRAIYFLDTPNKVVVQMNRDGGEIARFALPPNLPEPSAFYVSEGLRTIFTVHGSKVVATELRA